MKTYHLSPLGVEQIRDLVFMRLAEVQIHVGDVLPDNTEGGNRWFAIGKDIWTIVVDRDGVYGGPGYWFEWTDDTCFDNVSAVLTMLACAPDNQAAWEAATDMLAGNR